MRYLTIPALAVVRLGDQSAPVPFAQFVTNVADDPKLGASLAGIRTSVALVAAVEGRKPGELVAVSDGDWERAKAVVEEPSSPYVPAVMRQLLPYVDALLNAASEPPK